MRLACELIELLWGKVLEERKKRVVNDLIRDIKASLKMRTSATQVEDVDLYRVCREAYENRRCAYAAIEDRK